MLKGMMKGWGEDGRARGSEVERRGERRGEEERRKEKKEKREKGRLRVKLKEGGKRVQGSQVGHV